MIRARHQIGSTFTFLLAACTSAPLHYYTLVPPASALMATESTATFQFELLPVDVPTQVDQPQIVIRQGEQIASVLNGERWLAPLTDEVHNALSANLARDLNSLDVTGLPVNDRQRLRIMVILRRFESVPNSYAFIDAVWSVRLLKDSSTVTCSSQIRQAVDTGYASLVQGHQEALRQLASRIADVAQAAASGHTPSCPAR